MERLSFEMHKTYTETRLQLHLSPATIVLVDGNEVTRQFQISSVPSVGRSSFKLEGFLYFVIFFQDLLQIQVQIICGGCSLFRDYKGIIEYNSLPRII